MTIELPSLESTARVRPSSIRRDPALISCLNARSVRQRPWPTNQCAQVSGCEALAREPNLLFHAPPPRLSLPSLHRMRTMRFGLRATYLRAFDQLVKPAPVGNKYVCPCLVRTKPVCIDRVAAKFRSRMIGLTHSSSPSIALDRSGQIFLRLNVHFVQAQNIFPDGTVDSTVSGASRDAPHCGVATAIAHGNKQVDDDLFEKSRFRGTLDICAALAYRSARDSVVEPARPLPPSGKRRAEPAPADPLVPCRSRPNSHGS